MTDNELIAEFMGLFIIKENGKKYWGYDALFLQSETLDFDKSWDWLMPVVEKIIGLDNEKEFGLSIGQTGSICLIKGNHTIEDGWDLIIGSGKSTSAIDSVYQAVVEFIKWYNQNK